MAAAVAAAVRRRDGRDAEDSPSPKSSDTVQGAAGRLRKQRSQSLDLPPPGTGFWRYQRQAALSYMSMRVQVSVASLIAGNFLMNIIEKWIDPDGDQYTDIWVGADVFFNVSFALELCWNMYSFWLRRFWRSAWNVFDVIVVTIGIMNLLVSDLPGPLSLLRMMRAFRVFRLFKRVESLHKIMKSLSKAVPGVANAFLILLLVMSIYAILGVEFFGDFANGGNYTNELGDVVEIRTARDLQFGDENFGNFHRSLFTLFQVLTGESWSEVVARPMLHSPDATQAMGVSLFFISFNLVNGVVLINVVIAVLLEKMVDDEKPSHGDEQADTGEAESEFDENSFHLGLDSATVGLREAEAEQERETAPLNLKRAAADAGGPPAGPKAKRRTSAQAPKATEPDTDHANGQAKTSIAAMEADFLGLRADMAKIKLQMDMLMKEATQTVTACDVWQK